MSTTKYRLIVIEPLLDARDRLQVTNGIEEVSPNKKLWLFDRKFAANKRCLPKHMVITITTARKSPLSLTEVPEEVVREYARWLNICGDAQKTSETKSKEEALPITTEKEK